MFLNWKALIVHTANFGHLNLINLKLVHRVCTFKHFCILHPLQYIKSQDFKILFPGLAVQCLSVGVGVGHADELSEQEGALANISKHGTILDLNEKIRRPRQAEGADHSGDPLDWLRASVPGEPGQDYPVLSAIQVDFVIVIFLITIIIKDHSWP